MIKYRPQNILEDLIARTKAHVRELDNLQGLRFQRKILIGINEENGDATDTSSDVVKNKTLTNDEISTGEDSTVFPNFITTIFSRNCTDT